MGEGEWGGGVCEISPYSTHFSVWFGGERHVHTNKREGNAMVMQNNVKWNLPVFTLRIYHLYRSCIVRVTYMNIWYLNAQTSVLH